MTERAGEKVRLLVETSGSVSGIRTGGWGVVVVAVGVGLAGGVSSFVCAREVEEVEAFSSVDERGGVEEEGRPEEEASGEGVG